MIWVGWRQQRTETLLALGILAVLAALLIPTGVQMASAYRHDGLSACLAPSAPEACGQALGSFTSRFEQRSNLIAWFTLVPGLVGVLLAAPFILGLENGTYRLDWTQSITSRRWIAGKLGLAIVVALVTALALILLITWWRTPFVHLQGRMENSAFDSEGIAPFGYILFALGLAAAVGVVWRRAVPALVVGFAGYFAARIFVDTWLRQRLIAPITATWGVRDRGPNLDHAWILSQYPSDKLGHPVSVRFKFCIGSPHCLVQHGAGYTHAVYQPASRFWALQGIETALFCGVALALLAFAAWWAHERTA